MDEVRQTDHIWTYFIIFLGEFSGTAFLMYFGCMGLLPKFLDATSSPDLQAAIVWGTTITSVIMMFGHITRGHFNPAVTLCALILRIITPLKSVTYFVAHLTGATFGYWLLTVTLPAPLFGDLAWKNKTAGYCNTVLHANLTPLQGILAEFMGTSVLIYCVCSAWDPRNAIWSDSVALKFGFVILNLVITIGPLTGSSMNPARSFAPALINRLWRDHWIYWLAPMGASLATTLMYKYLYLPDAKEFFQSKEKLSDQFRHGSLYSRGEDRDNLLPKKLLPSDLK